MESGEVPPCGLVVPGGAMPRQAFSLLISRSTVFRSLYRSASWLTGRPSSAPLLLPVGSMEDLLRDDGLDAASAQVGSVARMKAWKILRDCRLRGDGVRHAMLGIARLHNLTLGG